MKFLKSAATVLAFLCILSLAGCGNSHTEQKASNKPPAYSQNVNQADSENRENSTENNETTTTLDKLLETVLLKGSVTAFQDGSLQIVPEQDDGQMIKAAADGMESSMESTTVFYGKDCLFQIASINSSTGAVNLKTATASDVKKSTSVYIYGEKQDDGKIHAAKVLITRFY